ncbi:hypothetical protein GQ53DRAFT_835114 [Thozetella sp. PMI_491]|nr:hypothetical protein GQ53DRAFT_835114 [Thozetella sp. PMI_491]
MSLFISKYALSICDLEARTFDTDLASFICHVVWQMEPEHELAVNKRLQVATVLCQAVLEFTNQCGFPLLFPRTSTAMTHTSLDHHIQVAKIFANLGDVLVNGRSVKTSGRTYSDLLGSTLYAAIKTRKYALVRCILEGDADVNDPKHRALETASLNSDREMIELLLDPQFKYCFSNTDFEAAINSALRFDNIEIATLLLDHADGQQLFAVIHDGIRYACFHGDMQSLLRFVGNANKRDEVAPQEEAAAHPLDLLFALPPLRRPKERPSRFIHFKKQRAKKPAAFFGLPAELRRQIYLLAFGAREIHLDLAYSRVDIQAPHSIDTLDLRAERTWTWGVSVCHRDPRADTSWDHCGTGDYPTVCTGNPLDCRVGAWGWLLSCQQAYVEGSEVLFTTNRFYTSSGVIVLHAPRIITHAHTNMIMHLSLTVQEGSIMDHARAHLRLQPGWPAYRALVSAIPDSFPGLKRLDLVVPGRWRGALWQDHSLDGTVTSPRWEDPDTVARFLEPVDKLMRAFRGQLEECQFVMERQTFDSLMTDQILTASRVESGPFMEHLTWERYWRSANLPNEAMPKDLGYWLKRVPSMGLEDDVTGELISPL